MLLCHHSFCSLALFGGKQTLSTQCRGAVKGWLFSAFLPHVFQSQKWSKTQTQLNKKWSLKYYFVCRVETVTTISIHFPFAIHIVSLFLSGCTACPLTASFSRDRFSIHPPISFCPVHFLLFYGLSFFFFFFGPGGAEFKGGLYHLLIYHEGPRGARTRGRKTQQDPAAKESLQGVWGGGSFLSHRNLSHVPGNVLPPYIQVTKHQIVAFSTGVDQWPHWQDSRISAKLVKSILKWPYLVLFSCFVTQAILSHSCWLSKYRLFAVKSQYVKCGYDFTEGGKKTTHFELFPENQQSIFLDTLNKRERYSL